MFRNTHHRLAKLFAGGLSRKQISEITGLSYTRLMTYHNDPAFGELIAQYQPEADAQHDQEIDEYRSLKLENMLKAERQLGEHLDQADDKEELLPINALLAISSDGADRLGYGKQSRQTNEVLHRVRVGGERSCPRVSSNPTIRCESGSSSAYLKGGKPMRRVVRSGHISLAAGFPPFSIEACPRHARAKGLA